jgi:hypothetical protein
VPPRNRLQVQTFASSWPKQLMPPGSAGWGLPMSIRRGAASSSCLTSSTQHVERRLGGAIQQERDLAGRNRGAAISSPPPSMLCSRLPTGDREEHWGVEASDTRGTTASYERTRISIGIIHYSWMPVRCYGLLMYFSCIHVI